MMDEISSFVNEWVWLSGFSVAMEIREMSGKLEMLGISLTGFHDDLPGFSWVMEMLSAGRRDFWEGSLATFP